MIPRKVELCPFLKSPSHGKMLQSVAYVACRHLKLKNDEKREARKLPQAIVLPHVIVQRNRSPITAAEAPCETLQPPGMPPEKPVKPL